MDLGTLKTQFMTMFMMQSKKGSSDIWHLMWTMMIMSGLEWLFRNSVVIGPVVWGFLEKRFTKSKKWMPEALTNVVAAAARPINTVTLVRQYEDKKETINISQKQKSGDDNVLTEQVDAVIEHISKLDSTRHIRFDGRCIINDKDDIELAPLIKGRIKNEEARVEITLFSTDLSISEIRAWIERIHESWVTEKHNRLGNRIYYFSEIPAAPPMTADVSNLSIKDGETSGKTVPKTYRWENMSKTLFFNMNEFLTNKSFSNVYGDHVVELKERLQLFVNHPEWYRERGIPHTLGILLHGIPGAGKTSTIKAIAHDTHSHIFSLALRPYTTQRQLMNLFYNDTVWVTDGDGKRVSYTIPQSKRLYVIEDIDCLTSVVLDRKIRQEEGLPPEVESGDAVTLSFLLNLIDGVLEMPGRKLVISANYPERLDKALIRPGRIDVNISFGKADVKFISEMMTGFYQKEVALEDIPTCLNNRFTPAEVTEACCRYYKSAEAALCYMGAKVAAMAPLAETRLEDILPQIIVSETEKPEIEVPETEAPETEKPETEAPETEKPETKQLPQNELSDHFNDVPPHRKIVVAPQPHVELPQMDSNADNLLEQLEKIKAAYADYANTIRKSQEALPQWSCLENDDYMGSSLISES